jgi:hypothetical protein
VTGVRSVPRPHLASRPPHRQPMQPELLMISRNRGGAGLRTTNYAAGSTPMIVINPRSLQSAARKGSPSVNSLATYIYLWLAIPYHAARHGYVSRAGNTRRRRGSLSSPREPEPDVLWPVQEPSAAALAPRVFGVILRLAVRGRRAARDAVSSWAGLPAAIGEVCGVRD